MSLPSAQQPESNHSSLSIARNLIEKAVRELPPFPAVATKILEETQSESGTAGNIEKLISTDHALAAKILRVVNSPYFGLSSQVVSLSQAVVLLGFSQVRTIVLSVCAMGMFQTQSPAIREVQHDLWSQSFGAANASEFILREMKLGSEQDLGFIGGLLQGVGSLFLLCTLPGQYIELTRQAATQKVQVTEVEREVLGVDHAEVGMLLAQHWNFPPSLAELIGQHEGPFSESTRPIVMCAHAADRVSQCVNAEQPIDVSTMDPFVQQWLGFSQEQLEGLQIYVTAKVAAVQQFLGSI